MSRTTEVASHTAFVSRDRPDTPTAYDERVAANHDVVIYRITGALFFGATASIGSVLDRINDAHKALIVDFSNVPFLDSTGANMIEGLAHKARRSDVDLWLTGASRDMRRVFITHGLKRPLVRYAATVDDALVKVRGADTASGDVA